MARRPRFILPGVPQHVIQRGNNRKPCFFTHEDYSTYLNLLQETSEKYQCEIHAYVLMTNHIHLLLTPLLPDSISKMMQSLGRRYVYYFNQTYSRTGTLWEGRYKASLIDSDNYLLACYRYIELNPVRANMVKLPSEYLYSSYHANAFGGYDKSIVAHSVYKKLGKTIELRLEAYRELFRCHVSEELLHTIRDSLNQELALGSDSFKNHIENTLNRSVRRKQAGRPVGECIRSN